MRYLTSVVLLGMGLSACAEQARETSEPLLHVSYDVTRELWQQINPLALQALEAEGVKISTVKQSHGGSGSQARAVIDGLHADVVSLAIPPDVDAICRSGLIDTGWEDELPHRSSPYHSTIVFLVRKGNPRGVRDWPDLIVPGVEVITPNPKTSGNGKLSFLAAWGSVIARGGDDTRALLFVRELYRRTPILETGGRGATSAFVQKKIGDVQLAFENEAWLALAESGGDVEIVYPPMSIRADPSLAVVDRNVERRGTMDAAHRYLAFSYTEVAQEIFAQHHLRPNNPMVFERHAKRFPRIELFTVDGVANGWEAAMERFFVDGGLFDQLLQPGSPKR